MDPPPGTRRAAVIGALSLVAFTAGSLALLEAAGGIDRLHSTVSRAGPWAPLLYIGLKAMTAILAPLSGTPLRVASGAFFGLWEGVLYTVIGDVIGGSISFWISRLWGKRVLASFVGAGSVAYFDGLVRRSGGWRVLLFIRLVIPGIYNYVSYAAGLTALPFRHYFLVTALAGIIPTTFVVAIGAGISANRGLLAVTYGGLVAVGILAMLGRRRFLGSIWRTMRGPMVDDVSKPPSVDAEEARDRAG